ncbi:MAG: hypothetical protein IJA34_04305 [Lachnospiraceae bacterium]|nr:hypothetical protein [Lachnospiraceae bacterium]
MKYEVKISGPVNIELSADEVTGVKFLSDSPNDANARSSELTLSATVEGKILYDALTEVQSDQLAAWAVKDHEEESDYATVEITCTGANASVARKVTLTSAFLAAYNESFNGNSSIGRFKAVFKQVKTKNSAFTVE